MVGPATPVTDQLPPPLGTLSLQCLNDLPTLRISLCRHLIRLPLPRPMPTVTSALPSFHRGMPLNGMSLVLVRPVRCR